MSYRAVPLEGGGRIGSYSQITNDIAGGAIRGAASGINQSVGAYGNYNSTGVWNQNFGRSALDTTSSNTAVGGRMNTEYLGGANKVLGSELKMIPNYIYFYHLDKFCVLPLYPESLSDHLDSTFAATDALSRSAPVFSYTKSGPRSIQIDLKLHRDMMNDLNRGVSNLKANVIDFNGEDYIDTLIKYLQAVALPRYREYTNGSKSVEPPMVAVRFGNSVFIKGVVNGGITVGYEKPIMSDEKYALVNISFQVTESDPYDADSIVVKGSFRGVAAANNMFRG